MRMTNYQQNLDWTLCMTALSNMLESVAIDTLQTPFFESGVNDGNLEDFAELFELANDVYVATLETHFASLECSRSTERGR